MSAQSSEAILPRVSLAWRSADGKGFDRFMATPLNNLEEERPIEGRSIRVRMWFGSSGISGPFAHA
jgi:hypothetical protein